MGRDPDYLAFMRRRLTTPPAPGSSGAGRGRRIARLRAEHAADLATLPRPDVGAVTDLTLDGPAGPLNARLYRPPGQSPDGPRAAGAGLVYFHGGGWALGDVDSYDPVVRALVLATGVTVVSVDYRRPPEAPFPAPLDDAVAAARDVHDRAAELGLDAARVGIAGDSAGAQLAASAALALRGTVHAPALQLLVYPAVDLRAVPPQPPDPDGLEFTDSGLESIVRLYTGDADRSRPELSPVTAPDLRGSPPAVIATAEYDKLRPQAERYAARLREAGVPTELLTGTGLDHGFLGWGSFARRPADAVADIGAAVRARL